MTDIKTDPVRKPPIIWTQNLTKQFSGTTVVEDINLDIPHGLIFGFVGPSGSGKTTTIRMLTGIYAPTEGEIRVMGKSPTRFSRHDRENIGYMPQHFALYPDLNVGENMGFAASIYGVSGGRSKRIHQLLDFVELDEDRRKLARRLSGGMQRRLSLAATLIHDPDLLFLDEPTAGIDPVLRRKFWDYFEELRDHGKTLFITTQYVGEAAHCDLVGVMGEGKLLVVDSPVGLRKQAFGGDVVILKTKERIHYEHATAINKLTCVLRNIERPSETEARIVVDDASTAIPDIMECCTQIDLPVDSIQEYLPPFDDIFVSLIRRYSQDA
jgi:ABC-2 type transport system ATP-binding protein